MSIIRTEIKRDMQHNYLVIKDDTINQSCYQEKMIKNNEIPGILPFHQQSMNGEKQIHYEITGFQSLSTVMEKVLLSQYQVIKIFNRIFELLKKLPEYLLREDDIVLDPEHIYIKLPDYETYICYYPGYHMLVKQQLAHLFEYLLGCINYKDKDTVYLVYSLYMKSKEIDCTVVQLQEILPKIEPQDKNEYFVEHTPKEPNNIVNKMEPTKIEKISTPKENKIEKENFFEAINLWYVGIGVGVIFLFFILYQSGLLLDGLSKRLSVVKTVICLIMLLSIAVFLVYAVNHKVLKKKVKQEPTHLSQVPLGELAVTKEESIVKMPAKPSNIVKQLSEEYNTPTEPISNSTKLPKQVLLETMLSSLCPEQYESIHFPCFPCYIGSAQEKVQVRLTMPGISRYHAKVSREGNVYYLTDLNSTNGSKINGEKIKPELNYELHDGDTISLANLSYQFQYSMLQDCMLQEYNNR